MRDELSETTAPRVLEERLAERERLAALISGVSTALVRAQALPAALSRCCDAIAAHLGAVSVRIWTLSPGASLLELQAGAGLQTPAAEERRVPLGEGEIGQIAQSRQPQILNEPPGEPGRLPFVGYPLVAEDRLVGVLALSSHASLRNAVLQALAVIADGVALRIEREQVQARLQEQTEVVETINRIGQLLSAELDLQKLVQAVTDAATELTGAEFGSFFYNVHNEQGDSYMLYTLSGVPGELFASFPMPRSTALFGPTFRGEATIRLNDVKQDPRYGKSSPYYGMPPGHLPVTSYLAVPVTSRSGEVIGGLFFGHSKPGIFSERHERIVEGLAAQAAIAMDNARLYQASQRAIHEREGLLASEQAARQQAEIASQAKDEFLSLLSHELRTPLNAILGWTRLLSAGNLEESVFTRAIETIDRNAKLQARLIEDMLDVSRIISGKLRLDAQPVDLTGVIHAAVDTLRSAAEAKSIRVNVVLDYGAGLVLGDPVRLQQVIWNLLSNAIKFTPKQGRIHIQLERINSHVEVTVSDTGPGIDEAFLPYVFDRFRQADSTAVKKHGGLGLGLAIVRQLAELHGGTVEAGNRDGGEGAVFVVKLPIMVLRKTPETHREEPVRVHPTLSGSVPFDCPPSLEGVRVLAVDDDADARYLLTNVLEKCGAKVRTCSSVREALAALEEDTPDILISDIGMPEESGYELIKELRAREAERGQRLPAVALTAYARVEDRLQALMAGYNMHIPKPVEPTELIVVIASLVPDKVG
jgi:signal transduction histidine kinase/ActR/RegA family two-component response regulator